MKKQLSKIPKISKSKKASSPKRPQFSPAIMKIARRELREFEANADKSFLIRAEMDRRLSYL